MMAAAKIVSAPPATFRKEPTGADAALPTCGERVRFSHLHEGQELPRQRAGGHNRHTIRKTSIEGKNLIRASPETVVEREKVVP